MVEEACWFGRWDRRQLGYGGGGATLAMVVADEHVRCWLQAEEMEARAKETHEVADVLVEEEREAERKLEEAKAYLEEVQERIARHREEGRSMLERAEVRGGSDRGTENAGVVERPVRGDALERKRHLIARTLVSSCGNVVAIVKATILLQGMRDRARLVRNTLGGLENEAEKLKWMVQALEGKNVS